MSRPEHVSPPEMFYNEKEAKKYAQSSRMMQIQAQISERAIELLNLPQGTHGLLLDIGCGTGMSGNVIEKHGHSWIGMDISPDMLTIAADDIQEEGSNGSVLCADMGSGLSFRGGTFDGAISISAVQWLCYANKKEHVPKLRLKRFFQDLYSCLNRGARAVIQLYPETPQQMEMITNAALSCGFTGGVVVDYPNSAKAKKFYLTLFAGVAAHQSLPQGKTEEEQSTFHPGQGFKKSSSSSVSYEETRRQFKNKKRNRRDNAGVKTREWISQKKERQKRQGKEVREDSKYSGRRRRNKF
mmetsp:Transcript_842/g.1355  ORF Transcript_842/g.1355 Transcript_842/m.1355 type:complete len:298 (+) Transcript_842:116-1009(+)